MLSHGNCYNHSDSETLEVTVKSVSNNQSIS